MKQANSMGTNVCESVCKNVSMARIGWRPLGQHRPKPESTCSSRTRLPVGCLGVQGWAQVYWPTGLVCTEAHSCQRRNGILAHPQRPETRSSLRIKEKLCRQVKKALEATWTLLTVHIWTLLICRKQCLNQVSGPFYTPLPNPDLSNTAFL